MFLTINQDLVTRLFRQLHKPNPTFLCKEKVDFTKNKPGPTCSKMVKIEKQILVATFELPTGEEPEQPSRNLKSGKNNHVKTLE